MRSVPALTLRASLIFTVRVPLSDATLARPTSFGLVALPVATATWRFETGADAVSLSLIALAWLSLRAESLPAATFSVVALGAGLVAGLGVAVGVGPGAEVAGA